MAVEVYPGDGCIVTTHDVVVKAIRQNVMFASVPLRCGKVSVGMQSDHQQSKRIKLKVGTFNLQMHRWTKTYHRRWVSRGRIYTKSAGLCCRNLWNLAKKKAIIIEEKDVSWVIGIKGSIQESCDYTPARVRLRITHVNFSLGWWEGWFSLSPESKQSQHVPFNDCVRTKWKE